MSSKGSAWTTVVLAAAVIVCSSRSASAQMKGHYVPGVTGLENGGQPPPGVSLALSAYVYPTDTIKNSDGNTIGGSPSITSSFLSLDLIAVTNAKILGANLGFQFIPVTYVKSRIESASLDVPGSFLFSDAEVQPLWLGWSTPRADYSVGWAVFLPTGEWELGGSDNGGLGMTSNDRKQLGARQLTDSHAGRV